MTYKKRFIRIFLRSIQKSLLGPCLIFPMAVIFLLAAIPGKAEEITLEEALKLFSQNNYDILITRYEMDKSLGDLIGAKLFPNPIFSFNGTGLGFKHGPRNNDDTQWIYNVDQLIELGGKRRLRIESTTATLEATKLSQRETIRNLLIGFYTVFYNLQLDQLNIDFAEYDLERFDKIQEVAEKRFDAGFLSLIDFTKIKLARIDLENNLTNLESQAKKDTENFSFLLGSETPFRPAKLTLQETYAEYV